MQRGEGNKRTEWAEKLTRCKLKEEEQEDGNLSSSLGDPKD